ncbi:MAG: signal peptidase II [Actinomycetota bacterium]|nr:signal peptidase II [Actinomycetota bacterium]
MARVRGAWSRAGLVLAAVLLADQVTKALVRSGVERGSEERVLPLVTLVHTRNSGVAFGVFANQIAVVVVLIALAIAALAAYFATHHDRPWAWLPTGLLAGGALGNVVDRVREGFVTDFVKLPYWPAFNVADAAITFGVLSLLLVSERSDRASKRP